MKKSSGITKIFFRLYLKLSSYSRAKLLDVNGKNILGAPDDVFILASKIIDVRNYAKKGLWAEAFSSTVCKVKM